MNEFHRWERMITLLAPSYGADYPMPPYGRDPFGARRCRDVAAKSPNRGACGRSAIVAVERQTDSSVLVSWSDPTRCRYDDQRWISAKSRIRSCCALTGRVIHIGDAIYKPQWRGAKRPANGAEMILATELDRLVVRLAGS
ncbi:DUF3331 domain-containing protein [Burkholderia sp. F1]|uniref:DUF3331 domain-containing protein n=1 Tax=Burkholderia sp. F1 TaxID=3366817 RepID=UPI003D70E11E